MKQINVKQAEKWLEKLRNENQQSYKDLTKFLRKYEKTQDDYDCYLKISHILLEHCDLTKEINMYLEEGNKFVVNRPENEKIKELIAYVKKKKSPVFEQIIKMINEVSSRDGGGESPEDKNRNIKNYLRDIIKGDEELEKITEEALDITGEELIHRQNLQHLKNTSIHEDTPGPRNPPPSSANNKNESHSVGPVRPVDESATTRKKIFPFSFPMNSHQEERIVFEYLKKNTESKVYMDFIKVLNIYFMCIISRAEAIEFMSKLNMKEQFEYVKDIVETRESDRRRTSIFRPLNDQDFSAYERASPSYVTIPLSYPILCSHRTAFASQVLNDKWVSVPHGSQENFNVRNKNPNETNLLKSQDERYEFDLYMRRLERSQSILDKILDTTQVKADKDVAALVEKVISLGVIQLIYKNSSKDQKEELEWHLKTSSVETCQIIRDRILGQIKELQKIKEIHANKAWEDVAVKNFFKALDLKGFQFKKNEKEKMKGTAFITELNERVKCLESGGEDKNMIVNFQDKKKFFSILNSFASSSRTEKCHSRKLPEVNEYDLTNEKRRKFYPVLILAFEDQEICQQVYSLALFYLNSSQLGEKQKISCKAFLEQVLIQYLGWQEPVRRSLSDSFDEQSFFTAVFENDFQKIDFTEWIYEEKEEIMAMETVHEKTPSNFKSNSEETRESYYLPQKSQNNLILYGSEQLYTFFRFLYAVYQRLIKMREVADSPQKLKLFQLLFYTCIKAKEGIKFEQNLNSLFGSYAYLFGTIYKLFDNLMKSMSSAYTCPINIESFKLKENESEEIYFLMLNRHCLNIGNLNSKLLRFNFGKDTKVLYLNSLESYYKTEDAVKDLTKKRADISRAIELYTVLALSDVEKKKRKGNEMLERNHSEYIFEGNSIKMLNYQEKEDVLLFTGKKQPLNKFLKRELKRAHKIISRIK